MFANLILYKMHGDAPDITRLAFNMELHGFEPCTPTQESTFGWVPPREEEGGALLEGIGGHLLAMLMIETRMLPAAVVKRRVDAMARAWLKETGRKPSRKVLKDMKTEARQELLPKSFTRQVKVPVWIDTRRMLVVIDATSGTRADVAALALAECWPRMNLHELRTVQSHSGCMTAWVRDERPPADFTLDRQVELRGDGNGENPPSVTLTDIDASSPEVRDWIDEGMRVVRLALTYRSRVSFVLHGNGHVKAATLLDLAFENRKTLDDVFDTDFVLRTGELGALLDALLGSLGGSMALPIEEAAAASKPAATTTEKEGATA